MYASNEADETVRVLTMLRAGKRDEAADLMEIFLDRSLITFTDPKSRAVTTHPAYVVRAVNVARDYRAKYPRTNAEPMLESAIQKVLQIRE